MTAPDLSLMILCLAMPTPPQLAWYRTSQTTSPVHWNCGVGVTGTRVRVAVGWGRRVLVGLGRGVLVGGEVGTGVSVGVSVGVAV